MPLTKIDITAENCGDFYVGAYMTGQLTLIGTRLAVVSAHTTQIIRCCYIDVLSIVHKTSPTIAIRYSPAVGAASQSISDTRIRLDLGRSKFARDNGFRFGALLSQQGDLGPNNYLYVRGDGINAIGSTTSVTGNYVAIIDEGLDTSTQGAPVVFDPSITSSPNFGCGWLCGSTFSAGNGNWPVNLPPTTMFPLNSEIVVEHRDGSHPLAFIELRDISGFRAIVAYGGPLYD